MKLSYLCSFLNFSVQNSTDHYFCFFYLAAKIRIATKGFGYFFHLQEFYFDSKQGFNNLGWQRGGVVCRRFFREGSRFNIILGHFLNVS